MRRILVIGAGAQGNVIGSVLSRADDIDAIVLADIDTERAQETAANIDSRKISVDHVDASRTDETRDVIAKGSYDLVINTAVPEFIPSVMRAALEARTHYLDLSSVAFYERKGKPIEQLEQEEEWKASGRTAFVNGGSAPGLTNVMAREGIDDLDEVDSVLIKDYSIIESEEFVALWSLPVYLKDCVEPPTVWENGAHRRKPIYSGEEFYDFPAPLNHRGKVYLHAHEESITIPLFAGKSVGYCEYKIGDPEIDVWRFVVEQLGMMDEKPVEIDGLRVRPRDVLFRKIPRTIAPQRLTKLAAEGRFNSRNMLVCDVIGTKDGERRTIRLWSDSPDTRETCEMLPGVSDVSLATSVPAATFALMLLRDQIHHTGVVLPEMLDRQERSIFLRGIGQYRIRIHKRIESRMR